MFRIIPKIKPFTLRVILSLTLIITTLGVWAQPTFNSAEIQANFPGWVLVTFNTSDNMTSNDGGTGFTIRVNSVTATIAQFEYTGLAGVPTNQLWFRLSSPVKFGQTVTIEYDDSGDTRENTSGNQLAAFAAQAVTNNVTAVTLAPLHSTTNVNPNANFTLNFGGTNVQANTGNITIRPLSPAGTDITIPVGDAQVSIVNDVVTINPTADLNPGTQYEIFFVDDVFRTTSNSALAGIAPGNWQFTTGGATITGFSPIDGATGIDVFSNLQVTFSDNVTANTGNIVIRNTTDGVDEHTISITDGTQISITNNVLTIDPATDLNPSKDYEVTMTAGTLLKSADGMNAAGIAVTDWNFTTAALPAFATTTFNPVDGATDVAKNANITITYNASIVANTGNIVIRNTTDGVDEHTISITDGTQVSITNNVLTIDPATDLNANKDYEVTMVADVVRRASDNTAAPALASGDLNFGTAITIVSISPTNGSTNIATNASFVITFDADVTAGTGNIRLADLTNGGTTNINVSALAFAGNTVTITPTLNPNTQYELRWAAGRINASGGAGSTVPVVSTGEWVFTTVSGISPNTLNPTNGAINITPGATNLSLTYSATVQAGTGNIVLTNLTDGSFENIDVTGGNVSIAGATVTITPPSGLTANKLYEVTIPAGGFVAATGANAPVPALIAGNWRFTTSSAISINTLTPTHNGINVATVANLVIDFSGNVQAGTGNIVVTPITPAGAAQNFDVNTLVTIAGAKVTVPNVSLNANTLYEVTFVNGVLKDATAPNSDVTGVTTGNWRFTTTSGITGTPTTPADNANNVALNTNPLITYSADIQKNTTGNVTITPINPAGAATVLPITDGSITVQNGNELLITLPDFNPNTEYQITVDDGALKAATQAQAEINGVTAGNWTFTTVGGVSITSPTVNACVGGGFVDIDPIVITEGSASSFATGATQTLVLTVPSNYTMQGGTGSVIVTGAEISNSSISVTANLITVQYDITGGTNINSIVISGLKIRADNAGAGNITNNGTGSAVQQGNSNGTIHAVLNSPNRPTAPTLSNTAFTFCQNTNINAQTVTAIGGGTYTWYDNAALANVLYTGATPNLVSNLGASSANVGTTTYYVTRSDGTCESASATVTVTIDTKPVASLVSSDADNVICEGETVTFTAISTPSAGANYIFRNGTTVLQNSGSNTYSSNTFTSGNITVEVTVNGCTTTSAAIALTVNGLPDVGYIESINSSFPNNQTAAVPLSDGDETTPTYGGTVGGNIVATTVGTYSGPGVVGTNFYPDVAGDGDHLITYTYTDPATGCSNSTTFTYNVFNPNGAIVGLNTSYCMGDAQTGNLTPSPNTSIFPNQIKKKVKLGFISVNITYEKTTSFTVQGTGVVGSGPYRFNPVTLGSYDITIKVRYNRSSGSPSVGSSYIEKEVRVGVTVSLLPTLVLGGLASQYCTDVASVNLDLRANGNSVSSGFTVKYKKNGSATVNSFAANVKNFNPATLGAGNYEIFFDYTDPSTGCSNTSSSSFFNIYDVPVPSFAFPASDNTHCVDVTSLAMVPRDGGTIITGANLGGLIFEIQKNQTGAYAQLGAGVTNINPSVYGVGDHNVRMKYTNSNGCTVTTGDQVLTVYALPVPNFTVGGSGSYCVDVTSVTMVPRDGGVNIVGANLNNVIFAIDQNSTGAFANQTAGDVTFDPSALGVGTHQIRFTYTNGNGCVATSAPTTITVLPLPDPNFAESNLVYCADVTSATLTLRDGTNNLITTQLNNANIEIDKNSSGAFAPPPPGSITKNIPASSVTLNPQLLGASLAGNPHLIRFTYTDGNSCQKTSATLSVTVNALPAPNFTLASGSAPFIYCVDATQQELVIRDATATLSAAELANAVFEIDKGAGYTANNGEVNVDLTNGKAYIVPSILGVSAGTPHKIRFTYTKANGCKLTSTHLNITVNPLPQPNITGVVSAGYCVDLTTATINLRDNLTALTAAQLSGGRVTFEVKKNSGSFAAPTNGEVSIAGAAVSIHPDKIGVGNHELRFTYTDDNTCVQTSTAVAVVVHALPDPNFTGLSAQYCVDNGTVTFVPRNGTTVINALGNVTYAMNTNGGGWVNNPGAINVNVGANTVTFNPATAGAGTHLIRFTYTDGNGCVQTSTPETTVIHALPQPNFTIAGNVTTYCIDAVSPLLTLRDNTTTLTAAQLNNVTFQVDKGQTGTYVANSGEISVDVANNQVLLNPAVLGVGIHNIRYVYTDGNTCVQTSAFMAITINPLPQPNITGVVTTGYCVDLTTATINLRDNLTALTAAQLSGGRVTFEVKKNSGSFAAPTNGEVSIAGAAVSIHPDKIGVGNHELRFTYTDDNTCVQTSTAVAVVVHALPDPNFTGLSAQYCVDNGTVTFVPRNGTTVINALGNVTYAMNTNGGGWVNNPGSINVNVGANTVTFNPATAGAGTHLIRFTYTDGNGCVQTSTPETTVIHALPQPNFTIAGNVTAYCRDAASPALTLTDATTGTTLNNNAGGELGRVVFQIDKGQTGTYANNNGEISILPATNQVLLNPAVLGVGVHDIRYVYTNANTCVATSNTLTITIHELPSPVINGIDATGYCESETSATLTLKDGSTDINISAINVVFTVDLNQSGTFTTPPAGSITPHIGSNTVTLNPSLIPVGVHKIKYTYTDGNSCVATSSTLVTFEILKLPTLTFTGLDATYCNDINSVQLRAFNNGTVLAPPSGAFKISTDNVNFSANSAIDPNTHILDPTKLTPGVYWVRYDYTDGLACANISGSQQFEVFFSPSDLDFTFNNTCFGDNVTFNATATGITTGWKWEWTFGDGGTSNVQNPSHKYPTFAGFQVTLTATNQHGCQFTITKTVTVTPVPTADFGSAGFCLGGTTQFTDQSTVSQPGNIVKWNWDFGDGTTSTLQNPTHMYAAAGTYVVTLRVETQGSISNCVDQITKTVYIFPYVTVSNTQNYFETFDANNGGWIPAGTNSSWQHGTPSGSTFDATSSGVWATNLSGAYNNNEVSYVESPCFNIDQMLRPVINFRYWVNTDVNFDGAVLLATLDDGVTWEVVGKVGSGIAWYNKTGILGNPGTQSAAQPSWNGNIIGWAGDTDTTWNVAKFPLDELKARLDASATDNLKTIRFRIAFGSDASNPIGSNLDGFAFDNVLIGERNRVALLEHFTNSSNAAANTENDFINTFTEGRTPEVVNIQYHTKFPGDDPLNNDNNAAPSARALYYGVAVTPRTALDGSTRDSVFSLYGQDDYSRRTLEAAPFSINLDFSGSTPTTLNVKATVNALNTVERPLIVQVAVIEREIAGVGSTGLVFKNVVKKMLPSAAGTLIDWTAGKTSEVITQSWELVNVYDNKQLGVVVFVQDDETKEVYQAAIGDPSSLLRTNGSNQSNDDKQVTGIADNQKHDFVVYPNPAVTQVYVGYKSLSFTENTPYIVYDQLGKVVASGTVAQGKQGVVIDTRQWSEGVYYVELTSSDGSSLKSKLVKH
ncbi:Ig-like domain-containing protein [uncultured Microscilla sp.]|uniref:Ig-like domain-containing protein n=1 Tax=uncultured Microscilla sp. TaxID=432653 RepID=UPI00261DB907|nr:Ig-like domain-containing protein [uncultured Microscilla sp.]